jgi:hypothetical protein
MRGFDRALLASLTSLAPDGQRSSRQVWLFVFAHGSYSIGAVCQRHLPPTHFYLLVLQICFRSKGLLSL